MIKEEQNPEYHSAARSVMKLTQDDVSRQVAMSPTMGGHNYAAILSPQTFKLGIYFAHLPLYSPKNSSKEMLGAENSNYYLRVNNF